MRTLRRSLIVLVILAAVLIGADRLALHLAEGQATDQLRASAGFGESTEVSIPGFPFLTQIISNDLTELDAHVDHYESAMPGGATGRVENLELKLHNVAFSNGYSNATARAATGSALVPYAELMHAAPTSGDQVRVTKLSDGGKNRIKVNLQAADGSKYTVYSTVSVEDDALRVRAQDLPASINGVPRDQLRQHTDFQQSITRLPGGIHLQHATPQPEGLRITVSGSHVPLRG